MKKITLVALTLLILNSCGGFKEAGKVLRNEKTKTTDEFFVKKKQPLVLPPYYNKIPEPGTLKEKKIDDQEKLKKILKAPSKNINNNNSSSIEKSIVDKIKSD
jgi:hypothetical protein